MKFTPVPANMTPTNVCEMMNEAYELLRTMNIEQLYKAQDKTYTNSMSEEERALLLYQIAETIRRKKAGQWLEYETS